MAKRVGKQTILLQSGIKILSYASVVGKKEYEGPLGNGFDRYFEDEFCGEDSFEKAESKLQETAIKVALEKGETESNDIDCIFAGDLLNQCISSNYNARTLNRPFVGIYGACSTMALSICLASLLLETGGAEKTIAVTSSHFCSSERQFRFPLEYGGIRTPSAQWTVTGSGAAVLNKKSGKQEIKAISFGKVNDLGVKDMNNMGAAMAPQDVKIRPYPTHEGMVLFYTQIQ